MYKIAFDNICCIDFMFVVISNIDRTVCSDKNREMSSINSRTRS